MLDIKIKPSFVLDDLPYAANALEPLISAQTVLVHHGKHHAGYVAKLNEHVQDTIYAGMQLEAVIMAAAEDAKAKAIFNNAAQIWNHNFYWLSMRPDGGGSLGGWIKSALDRDFGGQSQFCEAFAKAAAAQFGSGWIWLAVRPDGRLEVTSTSNAETPLTSGKVALLAMDVWEHAYYLDYQNKRADYVSAWLDKLVDWRFAEEKLRALRGR